MTKLIFISLCIFTSTLCFAGRPVFHSLTRQDLIERSDFVFAGWPSHQPSVNKCSSEFGKWQVYKVYKGDKSFEGKIISLANNNYKLLEEFKNGKGASYAQNIFREGKIDMEQSTSILFTKIDKDGCMELVANGAQEHRFKEAEIEALFTKDCDQAVRGLKMFLSSIANSCQSDSDCKSYNADPTPCQLPYVGDLNAEKIISSDDAVQLKAAISRTCTSRWAVMGACVPGSNKLPVQCNNNKCTEGISKTVLKKIANFETATIQSSCAPFDGPSVMIQAKTKNADYPIFVINWWSEDRAKLSPGKYTLIAEEKNGAHKDFSASFCAYQMGCKPIKNIELKLDVKPLNTPGTLDFKIKTLDNDTFEGNIPLNIIKNSQEICG